MIKKLLTKRSGFTLVELLIVIIIIAVLAAIAIPKFANSSQRSKDSALRSELATMRQAIELFKTDCGSYPATTDDLAATAAPANGKDSAGNAKAIVSTDWKGPYMSKINVDPVSSAAFTYSVTSPTVGKLTSSASGNDSNGVAYSTY